MIEKQITPESATLAAHKRFKLPDLAKVCVRKAHPKDEDPALTMVDVKRYVENGNRRLKKHKDSIEELVARRNEKADRQLLTSKRLAKHKAP